MSNEHTFRFQRTAQLLRSELGADASVMEIGSNGGSFRKYVPGPRWVTVDKYGDPDVRCDVNGLGVKLPFDSSSFDAVICTEVLEHLSCGSPLVAEMSRVLKAGGALYASVPNMVSLGSRIKWLLGRVPYMAASGDCGPPLGGTGIEVDGAWASGHLVDFNRKRLKGYLERGGLRVVHWYPMPTSLGRFRMPTRLTPLTLADFLLVRAVPNREHYP